MGFRHHITFILALLAIQGKGLELKTFSPCPTIIFTGPEGIDFSDSEKKLFCGDAQNKPWAKIPFPQALYFLKAFLEQRGYLSFTHRIQEDRLMVDLPKPTVVIHVEGIPEALRPERLRNILGERVTPIFLDQLEKRVLWLSKEAGYPCPEIKIKANPDGFLNIDLKLGKKLSIQSVTIKSGRDKGDNLRRFDAFRLGQPYRQENLDLTDQRATNGQYLLNNYFENSCEEDGIHLFQNSVPGYPRILSFGLGIDTEIAPKARASFSNLQLGKNDSNLTAATLLSFREQSVSLNGNIFILPISAPRLEFKSRYLRSQWPGFLNHKIEVLIGPTWKWDSLEHGYELKTGPGFNLEETLEPKPVEKFFSTFDASFSVLSHRLELNVNNPYEGFEVFGRVKMAQQGIFSDLSIFQISLGGRHLFNYRDFRPPFIIFGLRYSFETTQTPNSVSNLPLSLKYFLGGSQNLRGFPYQSLKGETGLGSLTSFFTSFETRVLDIFPWGLEPLSFIDAGFLGRTAFTIETPIFISLGAGLRLATKIGVFRSTFGRGVAAGTSMRIDPSAWNFYLSFGEEF